jgi:IS5 family transposase
MAATPVVEREYNITDKRATQASTGSQFATPANYDSQAALDTALATANAGFYTSARLRQMTKNDKVYALRTINDAAGI